MEATEASDFSLVLPPGTLTTRFLKMACNWLEGELFKNAFREEHLVTYNFLGTDLLEGHNNLHVAKDGLLQEFVLPFAGSVSTGRVGRSYELCKLVCDGAGIQIYMNSGNLASVSCDTVVPAWWCRVVKPGEATTVDVAEEVLTIALPLHICSSLNTTTAQKSEELVVNIKVPVLHAKAGSEKVGTSLVRAEWPLEILKRKGGRGGDAKSKSAENVAELLGVAGLTAAKQQAALELAVETADSSVAKRMRSGVSKLAQHLLK